MLKNKIVVAKNKIGIKRIANMYFITEKYIKKSTKNKNTCHVFTCSYQRPIQHAVQVVCKAFGSQVRSVPLYNLNCGCK